MTAHIFPDKVVQEWHGEWADWEELHESSQVKELQEKFNDLVQKASKGMKGGMKGTPANTGKGAKGTAR